MIPRIGEPLDRVDGRAKVTGSARYAYEHNLDDLAYGVLVTSTIASGTIKSIDTTAATKASGVLAVLTHRNAPKLTKPERGGLAEPRHIPFDPKIHYLGQAVAVVVADTFEHAMRGAELVSVAYDASTPRTELARHRAEAKDKSQSAFAKGDADAALGSAAVKIDATYRTPHEHHNPMEPHALVASWNGGRVTIYDSSQNIFAVRGTIAALFGIPGENVHVLSPFVGGAFGSKGSPWPHVPIAVMASKEVARPVKLVLTRKQLFFASGHRPETEQRVALGADRDGRLVALIHEGISQGTTINDYSERFTRSSREIYATPNLRVAHRVVELDVPSPTYMRAPGESPGMFAIESAMDELAYATGIDPLQLRIVNHADVSPATGKPWSSKSLKECYERAAERIGWAKRHPKPRSMRDGRWLVGYGMASAIYPAHRSPASARASLRADGTLLVTSGSHEMGMGTATVMAQLAAEILGLPFERVRFEYGDTTLPQAPISAGSMTAASVGSAVHGAVTSLKEKLIALATSDERSPLYRATEVDAHDERLTRRDDASRGERYSTLLTRHYMNSLDASFDAKPDVEESHSSQAFGAHFAEVRVDPDLGIARVHRMVSAFAGGRILNAKTAHSQYLGGIVWGIGMALLEQTHLDRRNGAFTNVNLGEYLVPVNADVRDIDIILVEEDDPHVNPIGVKGIGEVGIVGVAASIANAVYHATGKRIRELPITIDKLL